MKLKQKNMAARRYTILLGLLLSACSSTHSPLEPEYVQPSPPTEKAIASSVATLATEAKLTAPLEISAVRPSDHGLGGYFICVREAAPAADKPRRYYSAFFDNDSYKGSRLSIIMDQCELQTYSPAPAAAPATPPPPAQAATPAKHKSHRYSSSG